MMGRITAIKGIIVRAKDISGRLYETVRVGEEGYGEIIDILGNGLYSIQLFTNPEGLAIGDKVEEIGRPITVEVGPHLLGHFFDGLEMSLEERPFYKASIGNKIEARLEFIPSIKKGDKLSGGQSDRHGWWQYQSCSPRMSAARSKRCWKANSRSMIWYAMSMERMWRCRTNGLSGSRAPSEAHFRR